MIDLSTAYNEATKNIVTWRNRYDKRTYPHKIVLNMMYRAYAMQHIWIKYELHLLKNYKNQDEALIGMEQLYGMTAINEIHSHLESWLKNVPNQSIGGLIFTNYDAKATAAEFSNSILEELEFSYIFDLLQEKLVLYWIAFKQLGYNTQDAITQLTNIIIELEHEPSYEDIKGIFGNLIVKQYMHEHYESDSNALYDIANNGNYFLGFNITKHITEHEQYLIDVARKKTEYNYLDSILNDAGIEYFYHYTAKSNLPSIRENGGLYSWQYCQSHKLNVPIPGGSKETHALDEKYGLLNYVRLSICKDYPMAYVKKQQGIEVVVLKIRKDVALAQETLFSDINAIDSNHIHGGEIQHFKNINIQNALSNYNALDNLGKKYHDAEIMVKECVPIEYIVNIDNPDEFIIN